MARIGLNKHFWKNEIIRQLKKLWLPTNSYSTTGLQKFAEFRNGCAAYGGFSNRLFAQFLSAAEVAATDGGRALGPAVLRIFGNQTNASRYGNYHADLTRRFNAAGRSLLAYPSVIYIIFFVELFR